VLLPRLALLLVGFIAFACTGQKSVDELRDPPREITGRIIEISDEDDEISSMLIKSEELTLEVMIDPERDYGFALNHLYEHLETGEPVRVPIEQRDGALYARAIDDA
jgi:hypothetical protein